MIDNIFVAITILIIVVMVIGAVYQFIKLGREKQLEVVREWLLLAVVEAEKALGSGVGQIKLRYVYDLFISKFKYLSLIISFEQFSLLVDEALDTMRDMITNNKNLENYINKE